MRRIGFGVIFGVVTVFAAAAVAADEPPGSPEEVRPLLIGAKVPDVELRTGDGEQTSLYRAMGDEPAVLILYRGGW